jgi:hypothetical protein
MLNVTVPDRPCAPLDVVRIAPEAEGTFSVRDGLNREYACLPADQPAEVVVAGALGVHRVLYLDPDGRLLDEAVFQVNCETAIEDEGGSFARLLDMLTDTMLKWVSTGHISYLRIHSKRYKHYVSWLRDHVHALKGMKYWDDDLKTGIELYADSQREDGMIWDKCKQMLHSSLQTWRDWEFDYGDFIRKIPGNPKRRWQRIPVENDVEFLFLEGLYYTWKACGDDEWMKGLLDNAIRAVRYATTDTDYRWSEKFQLLKRGYTIDTWDFQSEDDARRSGSIMRWRSAGAQERTTEPATEAAAAAGLPSRNLRTLSTFGSRRMTHTTDGSKRWSSPRSPAPPPPCSPAPPPLAAAPFAICRQGHYNAQDEHD